MSSQQFFFAIYAHPNLPRDLILVTNSTKVLRIGFQAEGKEASSIPIQPHWRRIAVGEWNAREAQIGIVCAPLALLVLQLDEYFNGSRRNFAVPYELSVTDFQSKVLSALDKCVPYGRLASYARVAEFLGLESTSGDNYKCFRAVGTALARNPLPIVIPCHRVVPAALAKGEETLTEGVYSSANSSTASAGGYVGGNATKEALIDMEKRFLAAEHINGDSATKGGSSSSSALSSKKKSCQYGDGCYNHAADHRTRFAHADDSNGNGKNYSSGNHNDEKIKPLQKHEVVFGSDSPSPLIQQQQSQPTTAESEAAVVCKRTLCKYGDACYNSNADHLAKFVHHGAAASTSAAASCGASASAGSTSGAIDEPIIHKPNAALSVHLSLLWGDHRLLTVGAGNSVLGRGEFLGIRDKRCSRMQAEIDVEAITRFVSLTTHGVNPTVIVRNHRKYFVGKGMSMDLQDLDVISFLDEYRMRVSIAGGVVPRIPPASIHIEEVVSYPASSLEPAAKKARTGDAASDAKPMCQYGAECYQKGDAHVRKYRH